MTAFNADTRPRGLIGSLMFGGERAVLTPDYLRALHLAGMCAYSHVMDLAKPEMPQSVPNSVSPHGKRSV